MTRNIISKFIVILIVLFTALSIFWFFKTSVVKKQILSLISDSNSTISAVSVSVSGFPLQQKITIRGLKVQLDDSLLNIPPNQPPVINKYQIVIGSLEAKTGILSGDFKVSNIESVTFQGKDGVVNNVQFNQPQPQSEFTIQDGELLKFSYQDSGYKIVDSAKNILFENGISSIKFESNVSNEKYHNKVTAEFKDIQAFNLSNNLTNVTPVETKALPDTNSAQALPDANSVQTQPEPAPQPITNSQVTSEDFSKKNFLLDIEYIVSKEDAASNSETPSAPIPSETQTISSSGRKIESITIKNLEISSPLYKININGEISSFQANELPLGNVSIRLQKFDNLVIYLKALFPNMNIASTNKTEEANTIANVSNTTENSVANAATTAPTAVVTQNNTTSTTSENSPAAEIQNKMDLSANPDILENKKDIEKQQLLSNIISTVVDISKKNPATTEEVTVFDLRKEQGKELVINEIALSEIIMKSLSYVVENPTQNPINEGQEAASASVLIPAAQQETPKNIENTNQPKEGSKNKTTTTPKKPNNAN